MARRASIVASRPAAAEESAARQRVAIAPDLLPAVVVLACAALLMIITKALNPGSGVVQQISAILVTSIFLVVGSFGQGLTILLGGIDLSIGVVIGLSAMMISVLTNGSDQALPWALPATLVSCAGIGLINGIGIALGKVPPFIMTLASGISSFGVGLGFTAGLAQEPVAPALQAVMSAHWLEIPVPIYLIVGFLALASLFQNGTSEGRKLYAMGSSPGAARVLGLPIAALTIAAYTISGLCAGISGLLLAGYSSAATLDMGNPLLLPTIAAVVIGGARVTGGRGVYLGTFAGALFLSALDAIITVLSLSQGLRNIIEGAIIVIALLLQRSRVGR
jgi:ribose transport system permease protein